MWLAFLYIVFAILHSTDLLDKLEAQASKDEQRIQNLVDEGLEMKRKNASLQEANERFQGHVSRLEEALKVENAELSSLRKENTKLLRTLGQPPST